MYWNGIHINQIGKSINQTVIYANVLLLVKQAFFYVLEIRDYPALKNKDNHKSKHQ